MTLDSIDFFYLAIPAVRDIGDGSQDALLVRIRAGGLTGWGECEASPLVCIANWVCPLSHSACHAVRDSVLGQTLDSTEDIARISHLVRARGLDIAQTDHTLSGIDVALWDLWGKKTGRPVYQLLGYKKQFAKTPYGSQLFGDTPQETFEKGKHARKLGFRAVKFGWGPYGLGDVKTDDDHIAAAREGLGDDGILLVDAGTVWLDDVSKAQQRLAALKKHKALWLEEPFVSGALSSYHELSTLSGDVKLAGGEGAHDFYMARQMIDHAGIGFIQIDTGRIGGITTAKAVADYARAKGVTYVNHTFTTHLALSASIQPFAGMAESHLCEYPIESSALAQDLTKRKIEVNPAGQVLLPEAPGLGIDPDPAAIRKYLVDVEIRVKGELLYSTPDCKDL